MTIEFPYIIPVGCDVCHRGTDIPIDPHIEESMYHQIVWELIQRNWTFTREMKGHEIIKDTLTCPLCGRSNDETG